MGKALLFISPHLDDAILSCGSYMEQQSDQGHSILVATIFSKGNDNSNHNERRLHDKNSMKIVGATALHLNFTDAPFRNSSLCSFSSLLFHHESPHEKELVCQIEKAIDTLIKSKNVDECYFPLGVGGHVDHNLVYHAGLNISINRKCTCYFYEDAPYNTILHWTDIRKQHCLIKINPHKNTYCTLIKQNQQFINSYMTEEEDIQESELKYKKEIEALQKESNYVMQLKPHAEIESTPKKFKAMKEYKTEYDILLGSSPNLYNERIWRLSTI